jgi:hypothetical protein
MPETIIICKQLKEKDSMRTLRFVFLSTIVAIVVAFGGVGQVQAVTRPYSSGFQVQNLASTDADITITLYNEDGSVQVEATDTVPGSGQKTYATLDDLNNPPQTGFSGSAVISSSERVAAIVNVVSPDVSNIQTGEAYVGFEAGAQSVQLPLIFKSYFGFSTFFNVQNVSDTAANVTVTYQPGGATETATIQPGAAQRFDQDDNGDLPSGFAGSAVVTSDQDIVAAVVQAGETTTLVYNGFTQGSTTPYFPLVNTNNFDFLTGISLQNAGTQATEVTVSYTPSTAGTACTETKTIEPDASGFYAIDAFVKTIDGEDCADGATFVGSARVTANSTNQPLVGIVNQLNQVVNKGGSYASFDPGAATSTVVYPLIQDRWFGYFTGLSIINVGAASTTVTCTYSNSSVTQSDTLEPGETYTLEQLNTISDRYNGSGTCQASGSGQIVGIANQLLFAQDNDTFFVYEGINN